MKLKEKHVNGSHSIEPPNGFKLFKCSGHGISAVISLFREVFWKVDDC